MFCRFLCHVSSVTDSGGVLFVKSIGGTLLHVLSM